MSDNAATELDQLAEQFTSEASAVCTTEDLEALRLRWAGKKQGRLRALLGRMKDIAAADRRDYGQAVNRLKQQVQERLGELRDNLTSARSGPPPIDVSLPGRIPRIGALHPVTHTARLIEEIFAELGYSVAEGPEVEDDYHNFEALNIPAGHPARDTQDTFFLGGESSSRDLLLRTHTSPVQIRTMLERSEPPIRVICPGRVYRKDNDLRHSPMFHQIEGLAVGEGITLGDLKGTLEAFIQRLFSADTGVRLRPSFFPFTEPSAEVDITCPFCHGKGCAVCSGSGWMEILGTGMVDPRVLAGCGIDPERYSGFAFGLGIDRVAMIRFGIPNIRLLFDNDERLLRQIRS